MTDPRPITLGDRTFMVPVLPLRHNRVIYPLCRDLSVNNGEGDTESFMARLVAANGTPDAVRDDEWPKLEKIAMQAAMAADPTFTQDDFDNLPVTMPQLIDAFFIVRMQTGAWVSRMPGAEASAEEAPASGEVEGAASPR
jgi:hypothetical protein